jgi:hypothetical protein
MLSRDLGFRDSIAIAIESLKCTDNLPIAPDLVCSYHLLFQTSPIQTMSEPNQTIWIITDDVSQQQAPALFANNYTAIAQACEVSTQRLEQNLTRFLKLLAGVTSRALQKTQKQSVMQLDELECSIAIDSEGEISLLATGLKTEQ